MRWYRDYGYILKDRGIRFVHLDLRAGSCFNVVHALFNVKSRWLQMCPALLVGFYYVHCN